MDYNETLKLQQVYLPGTRIQMVGSEGSETLTPYEKGTVDFVDDLGQIFVCWDNGQKTALNPYKDKVQRLSIDDQILEAEELRDEQITANRRNRSKDHLGEQSELNEEQCYEEEKNKEKRRFR